MNSVNTQIEQHTVKVGALTFAYLQAGAGDPLVLLHGFPQHSHMWRSIMPTLAERFTIIAPDQRGMGGSSIPAGGYDKRTMATDMYQLVHEVLGYDRIHLVGYDQGAGTAYAYAAAYPEAVQRLVLAEFVFPGFGYEEYIAPKRGWDEGWQLVAFTVPDLCERFMAGRERDLLSWYFQIHCDKPNAVSTDDFEIYVRALQRPGVLRAGFNYFAAVWDDSDHNRELASKGKLTLPVLQIGGEKAVGAFGLPSVQQLASNVRGQVIEKAGHWLTDEQPAAFATALLDFLTEE
ncbi:MAG: alpha/beta hydrolase [Stenomitos rutilans HA7619-LM2]|jgi:pimeloyl-ACP methyl ester carboxylesterase|nr:alpha/beta hydrolase [Stenomitos rutilans HA7619-LM2]